MRAMSCVLLLAFAAHAGEVLVRVTFGNDPIEGAGIAVVEKDVEIVFEPLSFEPAARTDAAGEAVVDVPDEGRVVVAMAGYALAVAPVERETVDVALRPERIFTGTVTDKDGKPVVGAQVKLRTTFNFEATFPAETNERGRFAILGLWLDDYMLAIEADGFLATKFPNLTEADVEGGYALERPGTIRGVATDRDGKPLAGVQLRVAREAVETGEDGSFAVAPVTPGRRSVEVQAPFGGAPVAVDVPDGGEVVVSPLVLRPAVLRFRAVDEEEKLLDVTASVSGREAEIRHDEEGHSIVDAAPGQPVWLRLAADGYESKVVELDPPASESTHDLGTIALAPTAIVEVLVCRPDGTLAPGGKVGDVALNEGVARVPQGVHTVAVPDFVPQLVEVEPPGPVVVRLPEPAWLTGLVLCPDGPVAGARISAEPLETRTDAEGRFRFGPLPGDQARISVTAPSWEEAALTVALGEGDVVIRLEKSAAVLLRGRVLDGERPVQRFAVNGRAFVDEEGAFESLVGTRGPVEVIVDGRDFNFALPPPGEELIAQLPQGSARVTLEGGAAGREVRLLTLTREPLAAAETDGAGIAHFTRLRLGACLAVADDFRAAEVRIVDGEPPLVVLAAESTGVLRVVLASGVEFRGKARAPDYLARVEAGDTIVEARVPTGELLVDLAPPDAGSLTVRGADDLFVVEGRVGNARLICFPVERKVLPPGRYVIEADLVRREVVIGPEEAVEIDLEPGVHAASGRVVRPDGAPAHGALVSLVRQGNAEGVEAPVDPRGGFRFPGVPEGTYECFAQLGRWESGVARIVVRPDGVTSEGLPLVVRPPGDARIRLVGPGGTPLPAAWVRIDGRWNSTDPLGWAPLPGPEATLDLDLAGLGSIRNRRVRDGQTVELDRGAALVVLFGDVARERIEVRVDGRPWAPLEPDPIPRPEVPGRLRLDDLPAGDVEVEILPDPAVAPVPEEDAETPPPEPEITRVRLRPGMVTTVDVSG